jgi:hypothetical protein
MQPSTRSYELIFAASVTNLGMMHKLAVRRRPVVSTDQFTPYAQSGAATYIS